MNIIKSVNLRNFRSHQEFLLDCNKPTTLIIGENGSGKTSVLEAIYLCLRGKSFKGVDREMVKRNEVFYRVEIEYRDGRRVVARWNGGVREFEVGDKRTRRLPRDQRYPVVLFEPDDLHLVNSSPSRRRDSFDKLINQMSEDYGSALTRYTKALKQRNDLLKNDNVTRDDVFSWDVMLAKYTVTLRDWRRKIVREVNAVLTEIYRDIAQNQDVCEIRFESGGGSERDYLVALADKFERDKIIGHTTVGPHLDDYIFYFNQKEAEGSASRGEIRSMILALKFIEAAIVREKTGKNPVVLLDDIFSELDSMRQKQVINNFKDHQVIISSTAVPEGLDMAVKTLSGNT